MNKDCSYSSESAKMRCIKPLLMFIILFSGSSLFSGELLRRLTVFPMEVILLDSVLKEYDLNEISSNEKEELITKVVEAQDYASLKYLLQLKDVNNHYLIEITDKTFIFIFNKLFHSNLKLNKFQQRSWPLNTAKNLIEKIILASVKNQEPIVKLIDKLKTNYVEIVAQNLSNFGDRGEIAHALTSLYQADQLSINTVRLYLTFYDSLFFYDNNFKIHDLYDLICMLLPLKLNHEILIIACHGLLKSQLKIDPVAHYLPYSMKKKNLTIEDKAELLAFAFLEWSRNNFINFSARDFTLLVFLKKRFMALDKYTAEIKLITEFIKQTITTPKAELECVRNYNFWKSVYGKCLEYDDYSCVFAVGLALDHLSVEKAIMRLNNSSYVDIQLIKPFNNYKNYRHKLLQCNNKYCVPFIGIELRELITMAEIGLFNKEGIQANTFLYLSKFRRQIDSAGSNARRVDFQTQTEFTNILNAIVQLKETEIVPQSEAHKIYLKLWPENRRVHKVPKMYQKFPVIKPKKLSISMVEENANKEGVIKEQFLQDLKKLHKKRSNGSFSRFDTK